MSAAEYENIKAVGAIASKGTYNIGSEQKGLTYYTTNIASAALYADDFAPRKHKPDFENPAYIVGVKRPPESEIKKVKGTAEHEVGVKSQINEWDIVEVHRGTVVGFVQERFDEKGRSIMSAHTKTHWEQQDISQSRLALQTPTKRVGLKDEKEKPRPRLSRLRRRQDRLTYSKIKGHNSPASLPLGGLRRVGSA